MSLFLTFLNKNPQGKMAFLSLPYVWLRNISRRPFPSPRVCTDVRTGGRTLVRWRHDQIFSGWWVTNFSYPWCFAGALRALKLRYQSKDVEEISCLEVQPQFCSWNKVFGKEMSLSCETSYHLKTLLALRIPTYMPAFLSQHYNPPSPLRHLIMKGDFLSLFSLWYSPNQ